MGDVSLFEEHAGKTIDFNHCGMYAEHQVGKSNAS